MSHNNPNASAVLQMCLDLEQLGYGNLVADLHKKLENDKSFQQQVDTKWKTHQYPDRAITFTQVALDNRLEYMSPNANKVFIFMQAAAAHTGCIQCSYASMGSILEMSKSTVQAAVKELQSYSFITQKAPPVRHDPPIFEINPCIAYVGGAYSKKRRLEYKTGPGTKNIVQWTEPAYTVDYVKHKPAQKTDERYTDAGENETINSYYQANCDDYYYAKVIPLPHTPLTKKTKKTSETTTGSHH